LCLFFFFFQAEDGIRVFHVTGVQTCALPISRVPRNFASFFTEKKLAKLRGTLAIGHTRYSTTGDSALLNAQPIMVQSNKGMVARSEERRVGKECRSRRWR